jgi:endonuclease/exonuclease/phosphatase family metal-dependent hydrolase
MTFNIRGGLGMDGRRDTERIAAMVRAWSPDVVCFQEVHQRLPWSTWVDQPGLLARLLGMPVIFQRNLNLGFGGYGLAIASVFPLDEVQRRFLPGTGERRGALGVTASTPDGPVRVWCTHWGLTGNERVQQAAQVAAWVNGGTSPVVVCGDCNERADAPAVRRLLEDTDLLDVGAMTGTPTYPADAPTARIDYVFCSPGLRSQSCVVPDTQVSDHRPVVCSLA